MKKSENGVGEKIIVYEQPEAVDIERIRSFYAAMPQHMQDEILTLGVANYLLGSQDEQFIKEMHEFFFPNCKMKHYVRYD
jgi:hypothetical protein